MKQLILISLLLSLISCQPAGRKPAQFDSEQKAYYELGDIVVSPLAALEFFERYGDVWYLLNENMDILDTDLGQLVGFRQYNRMKHSFLLNGCTHQVLKKNGKYHKLCLIEDKKRRRFLIPGRQTVRKIKEGSFPGIMGMMPKNFDGKGISHYIKVNDCSKVRTLSGNCL
ncbi:MAG: hypothetical protein KAG61_08655 [Bacteriovoracaceae bacterium]|nr:hypothetical protein [Bacteriovoracaceae bacterium]